MNMETGIGGDPADYHELVDRRRRRRALIVGIVVALAALIAAAVLMRHRAPAGPAASAAAALPRVTVLVPGRQTIDAQIVSTGNIGARRDMPVGVAGEGGVVTRVLAEAGDWVAAGQVLATVDRSVQAQQAASLTASIGVARADAALAKSNLDRARKLVANGFVSKADIDSKQATLDAANARVAVSEAQLRQQRALIGRLDIRAPAAGLVLTRSIEPGQIVSGASGALFRIAMNGAMEMQARLTEEDLARLHVGSPAVVTPVGTAFKIKGQVWQISPIIDPTSRQGVVRIALPYDRALRPGGFANAEIGGGQGEMPLLPESAVLSDATGNFVYLIGAGDTVQRRAVKIGDVSARGVSVISGLAGNERVVMSAGAFLNPGDKVAPVLQAMPR